MHGTCAPIIAPMHEADAVIIGAGAASWRLTMRWISVRTVRRCRCTLAGSHGTSSTNIGSSRLSLSHRSRSRTWGILRADRVQ